MVPNRTNFINQTMRPQKRSMTAATPVAGRRPHTQAVTRPVAESDAGLRAGRSLGRSATIVGVAFIASRVLGLVREIILARQFGTSGEYDAYVSAFRVPDLLFLVVMSGAFGAA